MGIPIGKGRRGRRSYADYKPPKRKKGPGNDPFRIVFYLLVIAVGIWVYRNPEQVKQWLADQIPEDTSPAVAEGGSTTPTPSLDQFGIQAEEAYQNGQLDKAIGFYQQAADQAPNNVEYHFQIARLLLFQSAMQYGDKQTETLEAALKAAEKTILANPEQPEGYAIMGKVLDWQGRPDEGASQILRAFEINENYAVGHSYMAEILVDQTRWEQAQESINTALELDPNNVDVRRDYGYILESLGDYAGAATQYETAIQLHPKLSYIRMALGRAYRVVGRYQEALDQFFEVAAIEPENALIPYEIGRTYETYIGDPASAFQYYDRAIDLDEEFSSPWVRTGALHYVQSSYIQAIPAFERALELGVQTVDIYYQLGLSYANEGQCMEAIPNLQKAQDMAEGDERILDAVKAGFELCEQTPPEPPTTTP
ncbi:MAG: tetratricopeptide repeat protein [Anaerolineae bacterium]|nr:tetratricopeptide repeat protein [Anaerolineae bacterium]